VISAALAGVQEGQEAGENHEERADDPKSLVVVNTEGVEHPRESHEDKRET